MHNRQELDIVESGISSLADDILIRGKRIPVKLKNSLASHKKIKIKAQSSVDNNKMIFHKISTLALRVSES